MPRDRPTPPPFEPAELERSLDRYLVAGLIFIIVLITGFVLYRVREPSLRRDAKVAQLASYREIGAQLFNTNCSACHGKDATGGSAPVLNSQEFLKGTSDGQIGNLIGGGVPGTEMPPWSLAFGGAMTDEQIQQIVTYLRALEAQAPSVPTWRQGKAAPTPTTAAPSGG
jgi:cytochrome c oxidase cbb3-type subunit 3